MLLAELRPFASIKIRTALFIYHPICKSLGQNKKTLPDGEGFTLRIDFRG